MILSDQSVVQSAELAWNVDWGDAKKFQVPMENQKRASWAELYHTVETQHMYCLWEGPAPRLIRAGVSYDSQVLSDIEQ